MEEQLNSCWNRHIFLAGIRLFGNMIFLGTNICHRKCIIIAFIPTSCLYCFFIFLPKVRETWQPHVWTFTEWVSSFKQTVKRRSKGIFREHCMHSALMRSHRSRPQTVAQISLVQTSQRFWKQTPRFIPVECASYGNMEKHGWPPYLLSVQCIYKEQQSWLCAHHNSFPLFSIHRFVACEHSGGTSLTLIPLCSVVLTEACHLWFVGCYPSGGYSRLTPPPSFPASDTVVSGAVATAVSCLADTWRGPVDSFPADWADWVKELLIKSAKITALSSEDLPSSTSPPSRNEESGRASKYLLSASRLFGRGFSEHDDMFSRLFLTMSSAHSYCMTVLMVFTFQYK